MFIFFINAHGGFIPLINNWLSIGTHVISNNLPDIWLPNDFLTDSDLYNMMSNMDSVQKWIIIDSCYSGGFAKSINKLINALFVASSSAYKKSHTYATKGSRDAIGLFGFALSDGFSKENGKLKMDDGDDIVTFQEVVNYLTYWNGLTGFLNTIVYEEDLGDPITFSTDMWTPMGIKTSGLTGGLQVKKPPPISPILFLLLD